MMDGRWKWVKTRHADGRPNGNAIEMPDGSLWEFCEIEDVEVVPGRPECLEPQQVAITAFPAMLGACRNALALIRDMDPEYSKSAPTVKLLELVIAHAEGQLNPDSPIAARRARDD